jgi:gp16 family phage-associated protein
MTPQQAKEKLRKKGISTKQWAKDNGFDYSITINVLNGANKGHRGQAHKIAVALGIKEAEAA